jgi:DNA segregation ATPase FtsK/SpoIIIE, S-DNA-T family
MRAAAGTLTGHAIGEDPTPEEATDRLLGDILTVVDPDTTKVWSETVVDALRGTAWHLRRVGRAWSQEQPRQRSSPPRSSPTGVRTSQTWVAQSETCPGGNRMGITREAIVNAITDRDKRRENA